MLLLFVCCLGAGSTKVLNAAGDVSVTTTINLSNGSVTQEPGIEKTIEPPGCGSCENYQRGYCGCGHPVCVSLKGTNLSEAAGVGFSQLWGSSRQIKLEVICEERWRQTIARQVFLPFLEVRHEEDAEFALENCCASHSNSTDRCGLMGKVEVGTPIKPENNGEWDGPDASKISSGFVPLKIVNRDAYYFLKTPIVVAGWDGHPYYSWGKDLEATNRMFPGNRGPMTKQMIWEALNTQWSLTPGRCESEQRAG